MSSKACLRCGFVFSGKRSDAVFCSVKCRNAVRQARWTASNPERANAIWKRYAFTHKGTATLLMNYAKDRARAYDLEFDLDAKWLLPKIRTGVCEISGISLERVSPGDYRTHPFAPSLDRVVPSFGYTKDNVRLVCFAVNRARSDWGDEILMTIAKALVKNVDAKIRG